MSFSRIRWRIAVCYIGLIVLAMTVLTVYLLGSVRDTYLANLRSELVSEAHFAGDALSPTLAQNGSNELASLVDYYADLSGVRITIVSTDGAVLGDSQEDSARMDNLLYRPEVQEALLSGEGTSIRFNRVANYSVMYVAVAVADGDQTVGIVRLALPLDQIRADIDRLRRTIVGGTVVVALLALLLAVGIAERTAYPVRRLIEAVQRMTEGDLDTRLIPTTRDEVGTLTRTFNRMADHLRETINRLDDERAQLMVVFEHMADGVLITDGEGLVHLINPAALAIFDVSAEDALNRTLVQVVREHRIVEVWQTFRESGEDQVELIEAGPRGLFLQVIVTSLTTIEPGASLIILQDLSHVRRLETIRREFISNISHELRTPLAAVKAVVDTLRDGALKDPPVAQHFSDRLDDEIDALTQMVEELLELSSIESGRVPIRLIPTTLENIILPSVERLQLQADRAQLDVEVDIPADVPLVLGDLARLHQVVVNLLHNAIKFTPPGGKVSISAKAGEGEVVIAVSDTGVGIPGDVLPRIFERFYKEDRARSGSGTGLGLAIAKHVVQAHGGRIWAESTEGKGSTFYIALLAEG